MLRDKAKRYAEILRDSSLSDLDPVVILATPSPRRTRDRKGSHTNIPAPLSVTTWNSETQRSCSLPSHISAADARSHLPQRREAKI